MPDRRAEAFNISTFHTTCRACISRWSAVAAVALRRAMRLANSRRAVAVVEAESSASNCLCTLHPEHQLKCRLARAVSERPARQRKVAPVCEGSRVALLALASFNARAGLVEERAAARMLLAATAEGRAAQRGLLVTGRPAQRRLCADFSVGQRAVGIFMRAMRARHMAVVVQALTIHLQVLLVPKFPLRRRTPAAVQARAVCGVSVRAAATAATRLPITRQEMTQTQAIMVPAAAVAE